LERRRQVLEEVSESGPASRLDPEPDPVHHLDDDHRRAWFSLTTTPRPFGSFL
jgi:hypothetical protein